jgi:phosphoribosyl 1,2-cyclic phosphate phosphodiesterase
MSRRQVTITVLGSGTSTGVPVPTCNCQVCSSAEPKNRRTRCSILISCGGRNILVDSSTDLRHQALREKIDRIDAVLYTHTHADHVNGIDDLRPFSLVLGESIPIYACPDDLLVLRRVFSYIFEDTTGTGFRPRLHMREITGPFALFGLPVVPLELVHGPGSSLGYRIGPFAYVTDCNEIPESTLSRLSGVEILLIDALRFRSHASHLTIPQALEVADRLQVRRTLLTHLGHDVDVHRHGTQLPAGAELAYDGQRLTFDIDFS